MSKIELEILGLSSSQSQTGSFALILGEKNGKRRLPIIIGMFEAQAIAIEIEKISPNRPMTHDLFLSYSKSFGIDVKEIFIADLLEGVFYARISASNSEKEVEIDARPSDAIAIGIRFGVPVYTTEKIMSEAGIVLSDLEEEDDDDVDLLVEEEEEKVELPLDEKPSEELKVIMEKALIDENYELAAKIRDILESRS